MARLLQAVGRSAPFVNVLPTPIIAQRAPTTTDTNHAKGQGWIDESVSPSVMYWHLGGGDWNSNELTLSTDVLFTAALDTTASSSLAIKTYADALAIAGAPDASTTVKGIAELCTSAECLSGTDNTRIITSADIKEVFTKPFTFGSVTPAAGAFTTLGSTGAIDFDAGGSFESGGTTINIGADASADAINLGTGAASRAIIIGNVTSGTAVTVNTGTGHFTVNTTGAGDIILNSDDTMLLDSDGVLELNSSAGVINIGNDDIDQAINIGTDGARDVTLGSQNAAASLTLDSGTGAVNLGTTIAHTVTIGNKTGASALVLDTGTGNYALNGVGATTYTVGAATTTGTYTLGGTAQTGTMTLGDSSGTNIVQIGSGEGATTVNIAGGATSAKAVNIGIGAVANVLTLGSVSGAAQLDLLVGTGNFSLDGAATSTYTLAAATTSGTITFGGTAQTGTFSIGDTSGTMILELGAGEGATTVAVAGGATNAKAVDIGIGAVANVIRIGTVTGAASLALKVGTGNYDLDGAATSTYTVAASTTSGTYTLGGTAQTGTLTLGDSSGTNIVQVGSGEGATTINIAGGATSGNFVNIATGAVANAVVVGSVTSTSSLSLLSGTGRTTMTGTVKDIQVEHIFSSGTDLTITQSPILTTAATTAGVATGATGDVNLMYMQDGCLMEQFILGAGQTIIGPRMNGTNGLYISLDLTDNEGAEYNFGMRSNAKHVFTSQTSAAFFIEAQVYAADLSGLEPFMIGFRKVQANDADYTNYTDLYAIGINNATSGTNVTIFDNLNSGGFTLTDTGTAWTGGDGGTVTLKILVSASGVITATIDGGAPSTPVVMTFDADEVAPFIHFLHDTTTPGAIGLKTLKCGFQA